MSASMFTVNIKGLNVHEFFFAFCPGHQLQFEAKRSSEPKYCVPLNLSKLEVKLSDAEPPVLALRNLDKEINEDQTKILYCYQINEMFFRSSPVPFSDVFAVKSTSETYGNIFYVQFDAQQLPSYFMIKLYFTGQKQTMSDLQCVLLLVKDKKLIVQPATDASVTRRISIQ